MRWQHHYHSVSFFALPTNAAGMPGEPWSLVPSPWPPPALGLHGCEATSLRPWSSANSSPSLQRELHQLVNMRDGTSMMFQKWGLFAKQKMRLNPQNLPKLAKTWDTPVITAKKGWRYTVASQVRSKGSLGGHWALENHVSWILGASFIISDQNHQPIPKKKMRPGPLIATPII